MGIALGLDNAMISILTYIARILVRNPGLKTSIQKIIIFWKYYPRTSSGRIDL